MQKFTPAQWTLISLANHYGEDKEIYQDRLAFARELLPEIQAAGDMPQLKRVLEPWVSNASAPEEFTAAALSVWDITQGNPTNYVVGLDACNSGVQIISAGCRCVVGMRNSGLINTGKRPDQYTNIKQSMGLDIPRDQIKQATVPHLYGSDFVPMEVLGDLHGAFLDACNATMPAVEVCRALLTQAWDSEAYYHEWQMPDTGWSHVKVCSQVPYTGRFKEFSYTFLTQENKPKEIGTKGTKSLSANVTHSIDGWVLAELTARCDYNVVQYTKAIRAIDRHPMYGSSKTSYKLREFEAFWKRNQITSVHAADYVRADNLDGLSSEFLLALRELLVSSMDHTPFSLKVIFDEFGCLANNVNVMRQHYNNIMAELYQSTLLVNIVFDLSGVDLTPHLPAVDPLIVQAIKDNDYAIC